MFFKESAVSFLSIIWTSSSKDGWRPTSHKDKEEKSSVWTEINRQLLRVYRLFRCVWDTHCVFRKFRPLIWCHLSEQLFKREHYLAFTTLLLYYMRIFTLKNFWCSSKWMVDLTDNGHLYNGLISIELNDKFEIQWRVPGLWCKDENDW